MRRLFSVKSRTKFVVAAAVLSAVMLAFVGDASAETKDAGTDTGTVIKMCECRGSCRLVTMCLGNYCYKETVCDECANCHKARATVTEGQAVPRKVYRMGVRRSSASSVRARVREGQQPCLYRKGTTCVTHVTTYRRR
jgi:hypothetical protein